MVNALFPLTLTRKQYAMRLLIMVAVILVGMGSFAFAPSGNAAQIAAKVFGIVAYSYNVFGLSAPRLRNARISLWTLLLFLIPVGGLVMFAICLIAREKPELQRYFLRQTFRFAFLPLHERTRTS
jgi:uncharacterized membrane protein YhaH (DUF805 family)